MIPIEVDGGFVTDGTGGGKETRIIRSGHWSAVYATCQCNGSGAWVAGKLGKPQLFQQGANVVMGPIILQPGEQAQISVAGASANAQAAILYWGWMGDAKDGSDLASVVPSLETAGSLSGSVALSLAGTVPITGTVGTTDAGLAGSVAAALSQLQHVTDVNLTFGGTASFQFGAGQATAYPAGTASWQVVLRGIAGSSAKMVVTYFDPAGNVLYSTERHSNLILAGGQLVATGPAHGNSMKFDVTLSAGSGSPVASIYTAGVILGDRWFDSGIYQGLGIAASAGVLGGRDGVLWEVSNSVFSAGNTAVNLPTYRGPIQITANTTAAPYQFNFIDYDYLHNQLDASQQLYFQPSGGASTTLPTTIAFLAGLRYDLVFGNETGANLTASFSVRAIDDLQ